MCHKAACDCNVNDVDMECCSHCDSKGRCQHQEVPIMLNNGERWIYKCQTCECQVRLFIPRLNPPLPPINVIKSWYLFVNANEKYVHIRRAYQN